MVRLSSLVTWMLPSYFSSVQRTIYSPMPRPSPRLDTPANERLDAIPGAVPHPLDLPKGCKFAPRCKYCTRRCEEEEPELTEVAPGQQVRCFYARKEERHAKIDK